MKKNTFLLLFFLSFVAYSQLSFKESAAVLGVNESYGLSNLGGGVSFADFDNDGWDDLTFATSDGLETLFFRNVKGSFEQIDLGINDTYETKQVLWVDYDNDGDKDFFATSITGLNKMYENNGNMVFKDVTASTGLFTENLYTYGAAFGDIDNDGDLDVFLTHRDVITKNQRNYLYENEDGFFTDITESAGLFLENDLSFCASFFDYDNDGFQDIYVSNDKYTKSNKLYRNRGDNTFEDVSVQSGAGISIDAMSVTVEDYNNDGWLDIYVTNTTQGNYHLRNNGDGTFTNEAAAIGTAFYSIAWGAVFLDADNDTDLDLYVSGMLDGTSGLPSAFYENTGGVYSIPFNIGFENDNRKSFANAIGDTNNDGFPEIVVMNDTDPNFLWKNNTDKTNNWLKIRLEGTLSNSGGIGSTIEVFADGKAQFRAVLCGEGYLGQNSSYEFFGLKDATSVDYVKVKWPSGTVDLIQDVGTNQALKIVEGSGNAEEEVTEEAEEPTDDSSEDTSESTEEGSETSTEEEEVEESSPEEVISFEELEQQQCASQRMILYPNAFNYSSYTVCTEFNSRNLIAEVFDLHGRRVAKKLVSPSARTFSLETLKSGLYIVRISGGKEDYLRKIIRQ